mgnify:CR=1 FL=1
MLLHVIARGKIARSPEADLVAHVDGAELGLAGEDVEQVVDLSKDGVDYAPYLMGRLYDDWPDVRR